MRTTSQPTSQPTTTDWNLVAMAVSLVTAITYLLTQVG
jgi:hypothetical protein